MLLFYNRLYPTSRCGKKTLSLLRSPFPQAVSAVIHFNVSLHQINTWFLVWNPYLYMMMTCRWCRRCGRGWSGPWQHADSQRSAGHQASQWFPQPVAGQWCSSLLGSSGDYSPLVWENFCLCLEVAVLFLCCWCLYCLFLIVFWSQFWCVGFVCRLHCFHSGFLCYCYFYLVQMRKSWIHEIESCSSVHLVGCPSCATKTSMLYV